MLLSHLTEAWETLATMTPADYLRFRHKLGTASGLQSHQYRLIEFLLGAKDPAMLELHRSDPANYAELADDAALARYLLEEAGVATLGGSSFGPAGNGHLRIAYATSSAELRRALARMQGALAGYASKSPMKSDVATKN